MYITQDIAKRIKEQAKILSKPIKIMLSDCDLNINTISELSKGKQISYLTIAKIADYLNCSVDYLLGRTDIINTTPENDKARLIQMYNLLTDIEKGEILGRLEVITENREDK